MVNFLVFLMLTLQCFSQCNQVFGMSELDCTSNQVTVDFAKKMEKNRLYACGFGGREDKGKIMDFKVAFQFWDVLDIPSARRLIVNTVTLFLEEINNNKMVKKYLHHYPFTSHDIILDIFPERSQLIDKEHDESVIVSSDLGEVYYYRRSKEKIGPFIELHKESFECAQKLVKNN